VSENIFLPYPVPYQAQIASPELAEAIFVDGLDPIHDPRWSESGAQNPEEYSYWVERACGVACLKMCIDALGGPHRSLIEWARLGVQRGGYLIRTTEDGVAQEIGWIHKNLAGMAVEAGLHAVAKDASVEEICDLIREDSLVIVSISYEAGDDRLPITKKGGHLMVVVGFEKDDEKILAMYVNNPSGRRPELQARARLSIDRFLQAYTGRIIIIKKI